MSHKPYTRFMLSISSILTILMISTLAVSPALASGLLPQGDPVSQCAKGVLYHESGQDELALPLLEAGFAARDDAVFPDKNDLGNCALMFGLLIYKTRPDEALQAYAVALDAFQQSGNRVSEANTLYNTGVVYGNQGYYSRALNLFEQALPIVDKEGDQVGRGIILNEIGYVHFIQGQYAQAMDYYHRAQTIQSNGVDEWGLGITLDNIGSLYLDQGRTADALEYYEQALLVKEKVGDIEGRATTLNNIGLGYESLGDDVSALKNFNDALDLMTTQVEDPVNNAAVLTNIGNIYLNQGRYTEAKEYYQKALSLYERIGNPVGKAATLNQIGLSYAMEGNYKESLNYQQQALDIAQVAGDQKSTGISFYNIGYTFQKTNDPNQAIMYYEKAIEAFETVRAAAGSETARTSFVSQYSDLYDQAIELYYQQNQMEKAFFTSERGRARSFLDSLATGYVELHDNEATELYQKEQESYTVWQNIKAAWSQAKRENPSDKVLIAALESKLGQAEADYQATLNAITTRYDELAQLIPGRSKVLEVQQAQDLLDNETTLLSFWVLENQTLVFILNQDSLQVIPLNISRSTLHNQITAFRNFTDLETEFPDSSVELYKSLISPLKPYLNKTHLIIIPHSQLHYLPFAALTDGSRYLIEDYVITYLPSVNALPYIQQNAEEIGGQPLIVGNPITSSDNTTVVLPVEIDQLQPLQHAQTEAETIAKELGVQSYIQADATETMVKDESSQTKILHFAAHALFNRTAPLSSLVALSPDEENDGWLTVGEVYSLDLRNTDLIVLSACETQMGQLSLGDEFVGLTRAFFFAGAPTVIASLWSVDDKATSLLMKNFYTHMQDGLGKADALRQAQVDVRKEYPNPNFWAGFVLSGDPGEIKDLVQIGPEDTPSPVPSRLPNCGGTLSIIILAVVARMTKRRKM